MLIAVVLFIATLYLFYFLADEIVIEKENSFDIFVYGQLRLITSVFATRLMLLITFLGSTKFLLPAYILITIYYLFVRKNKKMALDISMTGLCGTGLLFLMKNIFRRQRPLDPLIQVSGYSFPSGHSFSSFTFFGLLIYIIWQTQIQKGWKIFLSILFFLIATAIATSRVYLHVHYASDVAGGFCLSVMWLLLSLWLLHKVDKKIFNTDRVKS